MNPSHSVPAVRGRARIALEMAAAGEPVTAIAAAVGTSPRTTRRYLARHRDQLAADAEHNTRLAIQRFELRSEKVITTLLEQLDVAADSTAADKGYACAKLGAAIVSAQESYARVALKLGLIRPLAVPDEMPTGSMIETLGVSVVAQLAVTMTQVHHEETERERLEAGSQTENLQDARPDASADARAPDQDEP